MFEQVMKAPIGRAVGILSPLLLIVTLVAGCSSTRTGDERTRVATPSATSEGATAAPSKEAGTPTARGGAMMADLPGERGVVLLGGVGLDAPGAPDLPDMWTYGSETGWLEITPPTLPELPEIGTGVVGYAFEFDRGSGKAVFADIEGNTWVYDPGTNTWEAKETKGGPTALLGASMVYDAVSDRMILFGGLDLDSLEFNNETWAYDLDSNTWERMHPKHSPSPRMYYAMAYDEGSDRVILFGGRNGGAVGDTWAYDYDADSWAKMSPAKSPAARSDSGMVYDPGRDRMVLFGGSEDHETAAFRDTWTYDYDEDAWTRLAVEGPRARAWHAMAFDREAGTVVLFGGGETHHVWAEVALDKDVFTPGEVEVRSIAAGLDGFVAVGGIYRDEPMVWKSEDGLTWRRVSDEQGGFDGPTFLPDLWGFAPEDGWTQVSPATEAVPEGSEVFGYDTQSERAVFVEEHGSTWAFDASTRTWEDRRPDKSPPAHGARMAYDSESDRLITFGGFRPSPRVFDDTWAYDYKSNTWTKMDPPTRPPARSHFAMAYDEASDRVVVFGGVDEFDDPFGDTWAYDYDTDTWELLSHHGGPNPRGFTAMADDPTGDRVILFGGAEGLSQEPQGDTWALDVGTGEWTELDPTPAPSPRARHVMATDAESGTIVLFGGGDSISAPTNETWVFDPRANTWSQIS